MNQSVSQENHSVSLDALTDFQLHQICTLYESGVGKGQTGSPDRNPCREGTAEYRAWDIGFAHGQEMREKEAVVVSPVIQAHTAALALIELACSVGSTVTELSEDGVWIDGQTAGDWTITVRRTDVPADGVDVPADAAIPTDDAIPTDAALPKGEAEQMALFGGALALPTAAPPSGPGHGDS